MATIANLYIDAGTSYNNLITVTSNAGAVIDLTDYTVKAQMRKSYGSSQYFDFDASVYNPTQGKIKLAMVHTLTNTIPPGRWLYDVEITSIEGTRTRVIEGIVIVTPQITQT